MNVCKYEYSYVCECVWHRYWTVTGLIGVADKQPITNGGRTIVLGLLFLSLLMQCVYTGSLNAMMMAGPTEYVVEGAADFIFKNSSLFSANHILCIPSKAAQAYFDASMMPVAKDNGVTIKTTNASDIKECLWKVYTDEATATFFDEPIVRWRIANNFKSKGHCSDLGGYCYDAENKTHMASRTEQNCVGEGEEHEWKTPPLGGSLFPVGQLFDSIAYVMAFPRKGGPGGAPTEKLQTYYRAFDQLIGYFLERGIIDKLETEFAGDAECAAPEGSLQMNTEQMFGKQDYLASGSGKGY